MSAKPNQPGMGDLLSAFMQQATQSKDTKKWWESFHYPETVIFDKTQLLNFARSALYGQSIVGQKMVFEYEIQVPSTLDKNLLTELVSKMEAIPLYEARSNFKGDMFFYIFDEGAFEVSTNRDVVHFRVVSLSKEKAELFANMLAYISVT